MSKLINLLPSIVVFLVAMPQAWANSFFSSSSSSTGSTTVGVNEYNALKSLLTGNLGLGVAILCAAYGCYLWLVAQKAGPGLTLIIIGATIALLPNLMDAMHINLCPLVTDLGGTCATQSFVNGQ